jgi:hypothetical protein
MKNGLLFHPKLPHQMNFANVSFLTKMKLFSTASFQKMPTKRTREAFVRVSPSEILSVQVKPIFSGKGVP